MSQFTNSITIRQIINVCAYGADMVYLVIRACDSLQI